MFEKILDYQKLDNRLLVLNRELKNLKEREDVNKYASLIKENQNRLTQIDIEAKKSIEIYEKCREDFKKISKEIENIKNKQDKMSDEEKESWANGEDNIDKKLATIERNLSIQVENVSNILKQFETCKNNIVNYKKIYLECKEKLVSVEKKYFPQIDEIKKTMLNLEKDVNQILLAKYKQLRQDKIFPVFVQVNHNSCGGCSMEFSSAHMTSLKQKGYLECEHCRRINYME